jgi:hypothetical protein
MDYEHSKENKAGFKKYKNYCARKVLNHRANHSFANDYESF